MIDTADIIQTNRKTCSLCFPVVYSPILNELPNIFIPCEEKASANICKSAAQLKPTIKQALQYKAEEPYKRPNQDKDNNPPYKSIEWLFPLCFIPHITIKSGKDENKIIHKEIMYASTTYKWQTFKNSAIANVPLNNL